MSRFQSSLLTLMSALALMSAGCSVALEDGRYGCARGPCPPRFYCHSDDLCYATEEADAGVAMDATDATSDVNAPSDAARDTGLDAPMHDAVVTDASMDAATVDAMQPDAPDAVDAFNPADAFSIDARSPDAYVRPDAGRDAGTDVGNDATLTREFFTPCTASSGCASGLCYFPNGERYATGYCTPMCTRRETCPSMASACTTNACVITCSSGSLCPSSTRCALNDRSAGECLAPGVAPLPLAPTPCGGPTRCDVGVCNDGVCRRACLNASGCPDTERCVVGTAAPQVCMP